jgi:hypothetical protein
MLAALALLSVPAVLYTLNPDGTPSCDCCEESGQDDGYEYPYEEDAKDTTEDKEDGDDRKDETKKVDTDGSKGKPAKDLREAQPLDEVRQHRERLIQAANEFIKQEDPRSTEAPPKPKSSSGNLKQPMSATRTYEQPAVAIAPPAQQLPAAAPPASKRPITPPRSVNVEKGSAEAPAERISPRNGTSSGGFKRDSEVAHPRSNSAYRLRLEHQHQQQLLQQQHEQYLAQLQAIRAGSPQRVKPPSTTASPATASTNPEAPSAPSAVPSPLATAAQPLQPARTAYTTALSATTPAARPSAPVRARVEAQVQQFEGISPRHKDHLPAAVATSVSYASTTTSTTAVSNVYHRERKETTSSSAAVKAVLPEPIHVPLTSVRAPSPQSILGHRTSPTASALPPLPPRRREDHSSPVAAAAASIAAPLPTPAVVTPASVAPVSSASTYLTPREKQQRALAELRKQEDTQRNAAKIMIQEELQRALDELHAQEKLQREQEETDRSKILEEQRRRELIQQSILEEKLRIERDEEQRRAERRRLQEQQRNMEEEQRQADQRAMTELLLEVERDRAAEEKRFQEEQLTRVERMLHDEEARQHEILEQLRLQNQYPYPRGHPKSNILSAIAAGNFVDTNPYPSVRSASASPSASPHISPNSSMRLKKSPAPETAATGPVPMFLPGSGSAPAPSAPAADANKAANGRARSPYHRSPQGASSGHHELTSHSLAAHQHHLEQHEHHERATSTTDLRAQAGAWSPLRNARPEEVHTVERHERTALEKHFEQHIDHRSETYHHYQDHTYASAGKAHTQVTPPSKFALGHPSYQAGSDMGTPVTGTTVSPLTAPTSALNTPSATASAAAALAASVNSRVSSQALQDALRTPERDGPDDTVLLQEELELRVLHAREDLALKVDYYIRTQKKFSSAVPLKYKCAVSKVTTDCEKHRKAYNELVGEEPFKIHSLLTFMESHPRFAVTGGRQMVGVTFLTPYQASDTRRVFGNFKCSKCIKYWMESGVNKSDYRTWENAYSYKDAYQQCYQCDVQVFPYHQRFLKKTELNFEDRGKHDVTRCSKCQSLKRPCYEV